MHLFVEHLNALGVSQMEFAHLTHVDPRRVRRWCEGQTLVPRWASLLIEILEQTPGALDDVRERQIFSDMIARLKAEKAREIRNGAA